MNNEQKPQAPKFSSTLMMVAIMFGLIFGMNVLRDMSKGNDPSYMSFNEVIKQVKEGKVKKLVFTPNTKEIVGYWKEEPVSQEVKLDQGSQNGEVPPHLVGKTTVIKKKPFFKSRGNLDTDTYSALLMKHGVVPEYTEPEAPNAFLQILLSFGPILLLVFIVFFFLGKLGKGGGQFGNITKKSIKLLPEDCKNIRFTDVAGCEEAKEEVQEIVEFLRNPSKYFKAGAKIPRGVLMQGPPGTGKTLLAKAVAGEAGVPFFYVNGSDFVEMFVGVGAGRVRELFNEARKHPRSIVFIDEIDAVGGKRSSHGMGGGHDEREQTLNALLSELQGVTSNRMSGTVVIAATNRVSHLDDALVRPGRFDRIVSVGLPDVKGREAILKVHSKGKAAIPQDLDYTSIAKTTAGMSGADLEKLINEAILFAVNDNRDTVTITDFEDARDKSTMGKALKSKVLSEHSKKSTSRHEIGHTLTGMMLEHIDPINKVTIVPRAIGALGVTQIEPSEDRVSMWKNQMKDHLVFLLGGQAAEFISYDDISTGASNDIERATEMAEHMVTTYGMSDLGKKKIKRDPYSGKLLASSQEMALIDKEVNTLLSEAFNKAKKILEDNKKAYDVLSYELYKRETLTRAEIEVIMEKLDEYTDESDYDLDNTENSKA